MLTLLQVQQSSIKNVAALCTSSTEFTQLVNEAVDLLMRRGDWIGTVLPIRVCAPRGCVTWPRYVGSVRKMNNCRGSIGIQTVWHDYQERAPRYNYGSWEHWRGHERNMTEQLRACTYNDIYGPNCQIRVYPQFQQDVGATVTIFGIDNNGQALVTINQDNSISQGLTITAALPFGVSTNPYFVSRIDRVVKSVTQGNLLMYAYDTVALQLWDLAVYEPSELNPSYVRYRLDGTWNMGIPSCGSNCLETVMALVKLKYIPASVPSDLILIDNIEALKLAMMSIKKTDQGDRVTARQLLEGAIEELNRQIEDVEPDSQLVIQNNVFGDYHLRNQQF